MKGKHNDDLCRWRQCQGRVLYANRDTAGELVDPIGVCHCRCHTRTRGATTYARVCRECGKRWGGMSIRKADQPTPWEQLSLLGEPDERERGVA